MLQSFEFKVKPEFGFRLATSTFKCVLPGWLMQTFAENGDWFQGLKYTCKLVSGPEVLQKFTERAYILKGTPSARVAVTGVVYILAGSA